MFKYAVFFVFSFDKGITKSRKADIKSQIVNHFYPITPVIYTETDEMLRTIESIMQTMMGLLIFIGLLGLRVSG